MPMGRVIFFDEIRAFGFLKPNDGSPDVFVHKRHLANRNRLQAEQLVEFDFATDDRGKRHADRVRAL